MAAGGNGCGAIEAVQEKAKEGSTDVVDTGCGTGQGHHIISKEVWRALENHEILRGLYRYRDSRFVARAKDLKAHCGYQDWHRKIDREIADWLDGHGKATAEKFEDFLREMYAREAIQARFPNGF